MAERLPNSAENSPACRKLRDAIKEVTGQRLVDRGFPPEMISRFSHVVLFFNDDGGKQATFTLPGQAFLPSTINVGFDVAWDTPDGSSNTHYYLSEEGLTLQAGDYYKDPHIVLPEEIAEHLATKMLEPETTISVTLISGYSG